MNRRHILIAIVLVLALAVGGERLVSLWKPLTATHTSTAQQMLIIETQTGARHSIQIELAQTPEQKANGLMFRNHLDDNAGMLFLNDADEVIGMWMKNTLIPLDMVFINSDGRIVNIAPEVIPGDLTPILSQGPVRGVLEINGGMAKKWGLQPGDRVIFAAP